MKKALLIVLALVMLTGIASAESSEETRRDELPEESITVPFATIGEAMNAEGYTGIGGGDEEHYVVVVETEGKFIRLVADTDEEAKKLSDATLEYTDSESLEAAFEQYNAYIRPLPDLLRGRRPSGYPDG